MKPILLSAIIIAKNAEDLLKECLESVQFCDEIILVNDGSIDKTVAIAKSFGAKVVQGMSNNFAENRNIGLRKASGEWVLYIDTDERISHPLRENIKFQISHSLRSVQANIKFKMENQHPRGVDVHSATLTPGVGEVAYKLRRKNFYLGNHQWPKIEELERLFLKEKLKGWHGKLHETPDIDGKIGLLDGYLLHYTHRDLASMLNKTIVWSEIEARLRLDANHPKIVVWRLIRVMITGFYDSYITQGGWKAGTMGIIESMYQSYSMFVTYARLWEMQNQKSENRKQKTEK